MGFPDSSVGKETACSSGDLGSIPGLGRFPGEGKGYPLQYSGLENSMDCIVHGVAKSQTRLSDFPSLPLEMLSSCLRWLPLFCPLSLHLLCLLLACLRRCWGSLQLQSQGCSSFEEFSASWSPVVSQPCSVTASEGRGEVRGNPHIFRGFSVSTALGSSWGPF